MKLSLFACLILLISANLVVLGQTSDKAELERMLNEFLAGAGRNDAAVHDRFWSEDLIYTRSAGARTNKPDLMKGVRSAPAAKEGDPVSVYTSEDVKIQQYGDAAVVAFTLVGTTTNADGAKTVSKFLNTGTFIKRNGEWRAVAWQATAIPKAEPAKAAVVPLKSTPSTGSKTADSRTYQKGPRGGCFYVNSSGKKVYVDKSHCG